MQCVHDLNYAISIRNKCVQAAEYFHLIQTEGKSRFLRTESEQESFISSIKAEPLDEVENFDIFMPEIKHNDSDNDSDGPAVDRINIAARKWVKHDDKFFNDLICMILAL